MGMGLQDSKSTRRGGLPLGGSSPDPPPGPCTPACRPPLPPEPGASPLRASPTGKYVENHGVVHNMFYNTSSKVKLPYHATLGVQRWWDNGSVPIWITAQRQVTPPPRGPRGSSPGRGGRRSPRLQRCPAPRPQGLRTGSFFYPGGNVTYQGMAPTLSRKEGVLHDYGNESEWRANVDTVMAWLTREDLHLVTLYFGEPDSTGHRYGPESPQRKQMVAQVDRTVGYLRDSIERHNLSASLNLIVTSDHGMRTVQKAASDLVELHKIPDFTFQDVEFELLDYGPNGMLLPKEGRLEQVLAALQHAHPRLHVYRKEDFPRAFRYAGHPRITPLLMYSDPGYVIHGRYSVQFNNGEHGFDNEDMDMKTIFRAVGPSFRAGLEAEPFESVHVYELMCQLLDIEPEANDGHPGVLRPLLRSGEPSWPTPCWAPVRAPARAPAPPSPQLVWEGSAASLSQCPGFEGEAVVCPRPALCGPLLALQCGHLPRGSCLEPSTHTRAHTRAHPPHSQPDPPPGRGHLDADTGRGLAGEGQAAGAGWGQQGPTSLTGSPHFPQGPLRAAGRPR
uniref:Ectonucleotide pyrophosphatase/phosphodiesterase 7 n=1 Tax=Oryctolagus cuniculus TaxID=9986 RepID=G1TQB2_RABIT